MNPIPNIADIWNDYRKEVSIDHAVLAELWCSRASPSLFARLESRYERANEHPGGVLRDPWAVCDLRAEVLLLGHLLFYEDPGWGDPTRIAAGRAGLKPWHVTDRGLRAAWAENEWSKHLRSYVIGEFYTAKEAVSELWCDGWWLGRGDRHALYDPLLEPHEVPYALALRIVALARARDLVREAAQLVSGTHVVSGIGGVELP